MCREHCGTGHTDRGVSHREQVDRAGEAHGAVQRLDLLHQRARGQFGQLERAADADELVGQFDGALGDQNIIERAAHVVAGALESECNELFLNASRAAPGR